MPRKAIAKAKPQLPATRNSGTAKRNANGQWLKGYSGAVGTDAARARKALNLDTLSALHDAFRRGGREAIDKVMKNAPAQFLKYLVLLVPRELEVTHTGGVKAMSDEALEQAIAAIEDMMAKRAEGMIDVTPTSDTTMDRDMGRDGETPNS